MKVLEQEYLKRLPRHLTVIHEELKLIATDSSPLELKKEADSILSRISGRDTVIALSEEGALYNSHQFSELLETYLSQGTPHLVFIIGGAYGLAAEVKNRSQLLLSLSPLTFPHQLVRVILAEQIYRASTIREGSPYHK
jgi:23S rRNA (pseudouridine1915-N3)-methyltransferase